MGAVNFDVSLYAKGPFIMGMFYTRRCHSRWVNFQIPDPQHIRAFRYWSPPNPSHPPVMYVTPTSRWPSRGLTRYQLLLRSRDTSRGRVAPPGSECRLNARMMREKTSHVHNDWPREAPLNQMGRPLSFYAILSPHFTRDLISGDDTLLYIAYVMLI